MSSNIKRDHKELIKEFDVQKVLAADKGKDVTLQSFQVKDFVAKGENYACIVTSVEVVYVKNGREFTSSYVAKVNPRHDNEGLSNMVNDLFEKEIGFFQVILPLINQELERKKEPRLRVAKYYHSVNERNKQVLYVEDLRNAGFKMNNRYKALTENHTLLILKELARLHGASTLLFSNNDDFRQVDLLKRFPCLIDQFNVMENFMGGSNDFYGKLAANTVALLERVSGYQFAVDFLEEKRNDFVEIMGNIVKPHGKFNVLCHGDCWNNNFLFK